MFDITRSACWHQRLYWPGDGGEFPSAKFKKSPFVILRMDVCKLTHHLMTLSGKKIPIQGSFLFFNYSHLLKILLGSRSMPVSKDIETHSCCWSAAEKWTAKRMRPLNSPERAPFGTSPSLIRLLDYT
jgi:hypothetical protein